MRVLLVEDHIDTARIVQRILAKEGHEVAMAATIAEARRLCEAGSYDLLVSDVVLPDGDGWSLMRELRGSGGGCDVPSIALSAYAYPDDLERSRRAGFALHLPKPFDLEELLRAVAYVAGLGDVADGV